MKFLVICALVFGMFACGGEKAKPTTQVVANPTVEAPAPTPVVTKDATPVVTAPAAPDMLEEGMSMDATPVAPVM